MHENIFSQAFLFENRNSVLRKSCHFAIWIIHTVSSQHTYIYIQFKSPSPQVPTNYRTSPSYPTNFALLHTFLSLFHPHFFTAAPQHTLHTRRRRRRQAYSSRRTGAYCRRRGVHSLFLKCVQALSPARCYTCCMRALVRPPSEIRLACVLYTYTYGWTVGWSSGRAAIAQSIARV